MKKLLIRFLLFVLRFCLYVGVVYLLIRLGSDAYRFGYQIYSESGVEAPPGNDMAIAIYEEQSVEEIAEMLKRFGLIRDEKVFLVQEKLSKHHGEIKPGNYVLNTSYSGNRIIDILTGYDKEPETEELE